MTNEASLCVPDLHREASTGRDRDLRDWEVVMPAQQSELGPYFTAENIALALAIVGTVVFSVLAARAEQRLWRKTRRVGCRRRMQRFITAGKSRLR
jgi:hypothetical protein